MQLNQEGSVDCMETDDNHIKVQDFISTNQKQNRFLAFE